MRCPDCNKFVSLDLNDPEVDGAIEVDVDYTDGTATGAVKCEVHIVRVCGECSTELKEANLELTAEFAPPPKGEKDHEFEAEEISVDSTERSTGKGRGLKSFYGAEVSFKVTCSCGCDFEYEGTMSDDIQASHMDEMT